MEDNLVNNKYRIERRDVLYPPSTSMLPLSHNGGSSPTRVMEAPVSLVSSYRRNQLDDLTDKPPGITTFMDLHAGCVDVRGITEVR